MTQPFSPQPTCREPGTVRSGHVWKEKVSGGPTATTSLGRHEPDKAGRALEGTGQEFRSWYFGTNHRHRHF